MVDKPQKKRKIITLDERAQEMVKAIQAHTASPSESATISYCIFETYRSLFPAYITQKGGGKQTKEEREAEKRAAEEAEQKNICDALGGKVEGGKCVYYTYNLRKRYEQRVSIGLLDRGLLDVQYQPSKAAVDRMKEEGKTEW